MSSQPDFAAVKRIGVIYTRIVGGGVGSGLQFARRPARSLHRLHRCDALRRWRLFRQHDVRLYRGEVSHRGHAYASEHEARRPRAAAS